MYRKIPLPLQRLATEAASMNSAIHMLEDRAGIFRHKIIFHPSSVNGWNLVIY